MIKCSTCFSYDRFLRKSTNLIFYKEVVLCPKKKASIILVLMDEVMDMIEKVGGILILRTELNAPAMEGISPADISGKKLLMFLRMTTIKYCLLVNSENSSLPTRTLKTSFFSP